MFKLSPERSCAVDVEVGISGLTAFTTSVAQPETKIRSATARPKSRTQRVKCMWLVRWRFGSKRQRRDDHQSPSELAGGRAGQVQAKKSSPEAAVFWKALRLRLTLALGLLLRLRTILIFLVLLLLVFIFILT